MGKLKDRMEMDMLLAQWKLWDEQLEQLQNKIEERQSTHRVAAIVATMPGAGAYSSLALASRKKACQNPGPCAWAHCSRTHACILSHLL